VYIYVNYTYEYGEEMRTNIVIDDKLMTVALKTSGLKTKKEVVEEGLRLLVKVKNQIKLKQLRGKLKWEGNLDEMRKDK
jgi:Arc/MetJ family transcription regulator